MNEEMKYIKLCPYYGSCNAPKCPLDPLQKFRISVKGEAKCRLSKTKRQKLGFLLPNQGKTEKEILGSEIWASLKPETQEKIKSTLKKMSFTSVKNPRKEKAE